MLLGIPDRFERTYYLPCQLAIRHTLSPPGMALHRMSKTWQARVDSPWSHQDLQCRWSSGLPWHCNCEQWKAVPEPLIHVCPCCRRYRCSFWKRLTIEWDPDGRKYATAFLWSPCRNCSEWTLGSCWEWLAVLPWLWPKNYTCLFKLQAVGRRKSLSKLPWQPWIHQDRALFLFPHGQCCTWCCIRLALLYTSQIYLKQVIHWHLLSSHQKRHFRHRTTATSL